MLVALGYIVGNVRLFQPMRFEFVGDFFFLSSIYFEE